MTKETRQKERVTRMLGKFWTAANVLSMARMVIVLPCAWIVYTQGVTRTLLVLVLFGILTDWADGKVARWSHTVSDWGKVLDPLADKFAAVAVSLALVARGVLPLWFFILVAGRDVGIFIGGAILARRTHIVVMAMMIGKITVTAIAITILAGLLEADTPVLQFSIGVTTSLLVISMIVYLIRFIRMMRLAPTIGVLPVNPMQEHTGKG